MKTKYTLLITALLLATMLVACNKEPELQTTTVAETSSDAPVTNRLTLIDWVDVSLPSVSNTEKQKVMKEINLALNNSIQLYNDLAVLSGEIVTDEEILESRITVKRNKILDLVTQVDVLTFMGNNELLDVSEKQSCSAYTNTLKNFIDTYVAIEDGLMTGSSLKGVDEALSGKAKTLQTMVEKFQTQTPIGDTGDLVEIETSTEELPTSPATTAVSEDDWGEGL